MKPRQRADYRSWGGILTADHLVSRPASPSDAQAALGQRGGAPARPLAVAGPMAMSRSIRMGC